jgi:hypothetical protein
MQLVLVELTTLAECEAETLALRHAVKHYFASFERVGTRIFSLRQDGHRVLTMSAPKAGVVRHVVGMHNRPPTPEELAALEPLLTAMGLQLAYTPDLMS